MKIKNKNFFGEVVFSGQKGWFLWAELNKNTDKKEKISK